jgi:hypothetical protein
VDAGEHLYGAVGSFHGLAHAGKLGTPREGG